MENIDKHLIKKLLLMYNFKEKFYTDPKTYIEGDKKVEQLPTKYFYCIQHFFNIHRIINNTKNIWSFTDTFKHLINKENILNFITN